MTASGGLDTMTKEAKVYPIDGIYGVLTLYTRVGLDAPFKKIAWFPTPAAIDEDHARRWLAWLLQQLKPLVPQDAYAAYRRRLTALMPNPDIYDIPNQLPRLLEYGGRGQWWPEMTGTHHTTPAGPLVKVTQEGLLTNFTERITIIPEKT